MTRIIDMEVSVPRFDVGDDQAHTEPGRGAPAVDTERPAGYGMANYGRIFRSRQEGARPPPGVGAGHVHGDARQAGRRARAAIWRRQRRDRGAAAPISRPHPRPRPHQRASRAWAACASSSAACASEGFHALGVSALVDGIPASDRRYYPLYTKAAELEDPRAHLLVDELRDGPAVRPRPSAAPRPGRHGLSRADHHRRPRRLAVGERDGRARAAPSRTCTWTPPRTARSTSASAARAGRCSCSSATR